MNFAQVLMCRRSGPAKQGRVRGVRRGQNFTAGHSTTRGGPRRQRVGLSMRDGGGERRARGGRGVLWGWEAVFRPRKAVAKRSGHGGCRVAGGDAAG